MIKHADRLGSWIQTYSGIQFWPLDPRPNEILIEDIAHALSQQCRFSGHVKSFHSVAYHSVLVSQFCSQETALWGLFHDASEAYLVDLPTPIKRYSRLGSEYRRIERLVMQAVCEKFGLVEEMPEEVDQADKLLLAWEQRDLMNPCSERWDSTSDIIPPKDLLIPLGSLESEKAFLNRFEELTK